MEIPKTIEFKMCHKKWVPTDIVEQNFWSIDLRITEINNIIKHRNKFLLTYELLLIKIIE